MARRPAETVSALTYRTGVQDANIAGNVHGGYLMKMCDDAAGIAAARLAGGSAVSADDDAVEILTPARGRALITTRSRVNAASPSPMESGARAVAGNGA